MFFSPAGSGRWAQIVARLARLEAALIKDRAPQSQGREQAARASLVA